MNITIWYPLVIMLVGLVLYFAANRDKHPKLMEIGRLTYLAGILGLTYLLVGKVFKV